MAGTHTRDSWLSAFKGLFNCMRSSEGDDEHNGNDDAVIDEINLHFYCDVKGDGDYGFTCADTEGETGPHFYEEISEEEIRRGGRRPAQLYWKARRTAPLVEPYQVG